MRRARLIPPWIRGRNRWERGFHLEQSIHGNELGSILLRHRIKNIISRFSVHTILDSERIQKVADSYAGFTGYALTEAASRMNN